VVPLEEVEPLLLGYETVALRFFFCRLGSVWVPTPSESPVEKSSIVLFAEPKFSTGWPIFEPTQWAFTQLNEFPVGTAWTANRRSPSVPPPRRSLRSDAAVRRSSAMHTTMVKKQLLNGSLCREATQRECGLHLDKR